MISEYGSQFNAYYPYLISLDGCGERRKALIKNGIAPELVEQYFSAIDLRHRNNADLIRKFVHPQFNIHYQFNMSNAQIGCALSHREVARDFSTRRGDLALVLEDDIVPTDKNFETHVKAVAKAFQEHARNGESFIVHLGVAPHWHRRVIHRPVSGGHSEQGPQKLFLHSDPINGLWYAHAYLLSKKAATRIAEQEDMLISNVDDWLYRRKIGVIDQIFYTQPFIFKQNESLESSIEPGRQGANFKTKARTEKCNKNADFIRLRPEFLRLLTRRISYSFHKMKPIIPYHLPAAKKP